MATTVEELLVRVSTQNTQSLDRLDAQLDNIDKRSKATAASMKKFGAAISGLAIGAFIGNAMKSADALQDLAEGFNLSAGYVKGFQIALREAGGDSKNAEKQIGTFYAKLQDAVSGGKNAQDAFAAVGISLQDLATLSEKDLMLKAAEGMRKLAAGSEQAAAKTAFFGKTAKALNIEKFIAELKAMDEVQLDQGIRSASDAIGRVEQAMDILQQGALQSIAPILDGFVKLTDGVAGSEKAVARAKLAFDVLFGAVAIGAVASLITNIAGATKVVLGLAAAFRATAIVQTAVLALSGVGLPLIALSLTAAAAAAVALDASMGDVSETSRDVSNSMDDVANKTGGAADEMSRLGKESKEAASWWEQTLKSASLGGYLVNLALNSSKQKPAEKPAATVDDPTTPPPPDRDVIDAAEQEAIRMAEEIQREMSDRTRRIKDLEVITDLARARRGADVIKQIRLDAEEEIYFYAQQVKEQQYTTDAQKQEEIAKKRIEVEQRATDQISQYQAQKAAEMRNVLSQSQSVFQSQLKEILTRDQLATPGALEGPTRASSDAFFSILESRAQLASIAGGEIGELMMEGITRTLDKLGNDNVIAKIYDGTLQLAYAMQEMNNKREAGLDITEEAARIEQQLTNTYNGQIEAIKMLAAQEAARKNSVPLGVKSVLDRVAEMNKPFELAADSTASVFDNLGRALDNFVDTGKLKFSDLARSIIADLIKIQLRAAATQLFSTIIGSIFGTSTTTSTPAPAGGVPSGNKSLMSSSPSDFIPVIASGDGGSKSMSMADMSQESKGGTTVVYNINAVDSQSFKQALAKDPVFLHGLVESGKRRIPR